MRRSSSGNGARTSAAALDVAFALAVALVALSPRASRAQECLLRFKEQTSGAAVADGASLCQTASGKLCTFNLQVCVNTEGCTPVDLKHKNIRASGHCGPVGKVHAKGNGTSSVCGGFAGVKVRLKNHGKKAGKCVIHAKAGTDKDTLTLNCQPASSPCPTTSMTTTTTTHPTTTTCTQGGDVPLSLGFTNTPGTTSCGSAGFGSAPAAPFNGELDSDTACSTKINDLGRGCLYIGGGNAKAIPPGQVPSGATSFFDICGSNLVASNGAGALTCTKGAGPSKNCLNNDTLPACTSDADCAGYTAACHGVANCFFGPPLEFPNPALSALSTCVLNVIDTDASGTSDPSTGSSTVTLPLASEVYVTGNQGSPCPHCVSSQCTYGANTGGACSTTASSLTSHDCPPERGGGAFQAPLSVTLQPLTTGTTTLTSASGNFCPSQKTAGAFALGTAQCIKTVGSPAGDLTDGQPHSAIIAAAFCIPTTTNSTIDGVADLPGPGLTSLPGMAQLH